MSVLPASILCLFDSILWLTENAFCHMRRNYHAVRTTPVQNNGPMPFSKDLHKRYKPRATFALPASGFSLASFSNCDLQTAQFSSNLLHSDNYIHLMPFTVAILDDRHVSVAVPAFHQPLLHS